MTDIAKQTDELIEDCASLQRQVLKRFTQSVLEEMKSTLMENKSNDSRRTRRKTIEGTMSKTLHNSDISGTKKNVKDVKVFGNGDMFSLLSKASSENEGWMKSTKAMEIPRVGCIVQVTTQQCNPDGSYSVAEALTFVPDVHVVDDKHHGGRKLEVC